MPVWYQQLIYGDNVDAWKSASGFALFVGIVVIIILFGIKRLK